MTDRMDSSFDAQIERFVSSEALSSEEAGVSTSLRPGSFAEYPGQKRARENLQIFVSAAKIRKHVLDHVLLHGPPGLGKTTLSRIIASEMGTSFYQTSGPSIEKPGDLAGILAGIDEGGVLFIDEIHRLSIAVEEVLYSAMEDFSMDIIVGQGPTARTVKVPVQPFTLVGATTRTSLLSSPLRSRFGIQERLEFYSPDELKAIILRSAFVEGISIDDKGAYRLAVRSRGTPRVANRLIRRVRDFADYHGRDRLDQEIVEIALGRLDIDEMGLDRMDRNILVTMHTKYSERPVGLDTLAATIGEEKTTIEDVYEPYLLHMGLISRGPRGRELTVSGVKVAEASTSHF